MRLSFCHGSRLPGAWALVGWWALQWVAAGATDAFLDAGDGLAWRRDQKRSGPLTYFVVRIDRQRSDLSLQPTLAQGGQIGLNTLTAQLKLLPEEAGKPVAAINGDFYTTESELFPGDPRGLFITRGELISDPAERDCFWVDAEGRPQIGEVKSRFALVWPDGTSTPLGLNEHPSAAPAVLYTAAVDTSQRPRLALPLAGTDPVPAGTAPFRIGETYPIRLRPRSANPDANPAALYLAKELRDRARRLPPGSEFKISTRTVPDLKGTRMAIGGGPALVRGRKVQPANAVKSDEAHPRSAIGWSLKHYFLVVVDGRQPGWSMGVTLPELAEYMAGLGCEEAINLDGGGSTELWLKGRILNRPCYGRERPTATGLAVVQKPSRSTPPIPGPAKPQRP